MTEKIPLHCSDYVSHYTLDAYDLPVPEDMSYFSRMLENRRLELISRLVPGKGGANVLDAGCGAGWLSEMLHARGFRVTALNLGFDSVRRASERLKSKASGISFLCGDVFKLPCRDGSFDAVVISEVIEHLEKPQDALTEIARVLRPNGSLIISTPYKECIEETLCIHCNKKTPVNAHLHSFDKTIIGNILEETGFIVQKYITFVSRPAERLGMAGFTFFLPFGMWRFLDGIACKVLGRESFMVVRAVRRE